MSEVRILSKKTSEGFALERPFHFIVVVWGATFRNYFVRFCLPSLLSPGNLPALATRQRSKFLIVTRPADWAAMQSEPIFELLKQYVLAVYIEIPECPPNRSGCEHMSIGHKLACEYAFRESAYAAVLTPDCMLSEDTISHLQKFAQSGVELVLAAALRFGEEPFFGCLRSRGALPQEGSERWGEPLSISARDMVYAAVRGFHSHSASCEYGSAHFPHVPHCAWWRVPDEDGIVLYSLSWAPLLIDYAVFKRHDTSTMDEWTIDGDYIFKNLASIKRIHVIQDSDEGFIASWAPLASQEMKQFGILKLSFIARPAWALQFVEAFHSSFFDPLKRRLFFRPVRWHSRAFDEGKWSLVESKSMQTIRALVSPPDDEQPDRLAPQPNPRIRGALIGALAIFSIRFRDLPGIVVVRFIAAARGDKHVRRSIVWHLRRQWHRAFGRPFNEPRPTRP
jgi:hypothetical protein